MKLNPDGKTVAASDLLAPGIGEIIGGSQREDNLEILQNKIKELTLNISPAPSQSLAVIKGVLTYTKSCSWKNL